MNFYSNFIIKVNLNNQWSFLHWPNNTSNESQINCFSNHFNYAKWLWNFFPTVNMNVITQSFQTECAVLVSTMESSFAHKGLRFILSGSIFLECIQGESAFSLFQLGNSFRRTISLLKYAAPFEQNHFCFPNQVAPSWVFCLFK